ncbi:MAG: putative metal-binding motif-containing protein [Myxococcota bacterium]
MAARTLGTGRNWRDLKGVRILSGVMFLRTATDFPTIPPARLVLCALIAVAGVWPPCAVQADPKPACAAGSTLVVTEFALGGKGAPAWVEVTNISNLAVSLDKVTMQVESSEAKSATVGLGLAWKVLGPGEAVAFGHQPPAKNPEKPTVVDLGGEFALAGCKGAISLEGPSGPLDDVEWDHCEGGNPSQPAVWGLDPAFADPCQNDDQALWCQPSGPASTPSGTPGKSNLSCDLDGDGFRVQDGDCNDQNGDAFPTAVEVCNGIDDDCDGATDEGVVAPVGTCLAQGVCAVPNKDGTAVAKCNGAAGYSCAYSYGYEAAVETLCDGFDNDCDGQTDEDLLNACGVCGPTPDEVCNGADDDCDGQTDEQVQIALTCGEVGVCAQAQPVCAAGGVAQCALPLSWQATETLCDDLDNDCDGATDEDLGLGLACTVGDGLCAANGVWKCGTAGAVVCDADQKSGVAELCGDGVDNNCDGQTDEGFDVGKQCEAGVGVCRVVGKVMCAGDRTSAECNVQPISPTSGELCGNELDDDCDGQTDEDGCQTDSTAAGWSCTSGQGIPASSPGTGLLLVFGLLGLYLWRTRVRRG